MLDINERDIAVVPQNEVAGYASMPSYEPFLAKLIRETSSVEFALRVPRLKPSQTGYLRTVLRGRGYRLHYRSAESHTFLWVEKKA